LVADLVGESGHVIGVDRSAAAVQRANTRAIRRNPPNVSFVVGDPAAMSFGKPFDAIVGRFVLMYRDDPVDSLRKITKHLRPNGLVVFQELIRAQAALARPFLLLTKLHGGWERHCAVAVPDPNSD
jgi:ubiquinone/menaquinone biosynthesis C-methylase UbiE